MKFGLSDKDYQSIINVIKEYPIVERVKIFGSRAMDTHKPGSDIDLAVYGKCDHATVTRLKMQLEYDLTLPYKFDVILYEEIESLEVKAHIDRVGKLVYG